MQEWAVLESREDASVNFVADAEDGGKVECRYVRRTPDYFIAYLSSHTGCRHACRFCHLTQTGQTSFTSVTPEGMLAQADRVFAHYDAVKEQQGSAERVHFNWMARGEALSNPHFREHAAEIVGNLADRAWRRGLMPKFGVSTILPTDLEPLDLSRIFCSLPVTIYYSLYSLDPAFRKRWLPNALPAEQGLDLLAAHQKAFGAEVVLHWAFIKDENDSPESIDAICRAVTARGLRARFNLVRYNPFSPGQGTESDEPVLERNFRGMADSLRHPESRIVPRVGYDVKASCGMFVT